ncbi:MAG: winged helix-turn-helix domain-containing protein [Candidatus Bathyarchaeia archaeon]
MANYTNGHNLFCLPLHRKYRSRMEIMALILDAARNGGVTFYSIMKRTKINYKQLKRYLPSLINMGFIEAEVKGSRISFRVSESGLAFLRQYNILRGMLLSTSAGDKQIGMVHKEFISSKMQRRAALLLTT